jgi:hypothetical protein
MFVSSISSQTQEENSEERITTEDVQSEVSNDHSGNSQAEINTEGSQTEESENEMKYECKLIVNGKDITEDNYVKLHKEQRYAELPLVAIMQALGADVDWKTEEIAELTLYETKYVLDIRNNSLVVEDGGNDFKYNIITPPPGSSVQYKTMERELIIEHIVIRDLLDMLSMTMTLNYQDMSIIID